MPVVESTGPLFRAGGRPKLLEVLLDVDISARLYGFLLYVGLPVLLEVLLDVDISALLYGFSSDPANLSTELAIGFLDGPGGGIRARAEIRFCGYTRRNISF